MKYRPHWLAALAALALLASLGGCAIKKVGVTERGNLAQDVMQRDGNLQQAALEQHRYASKEATAGGASVGGGGCGCN